MKNKKFETIFIDEDAYQYVGQELTPSIFVKLLIAFYDGKQFHRQSAIDTITEFHKSNGGVLLKSEYISVFKKACQQLKEKGLKNIGYGIWRLSYQTKTIQIEDKPKREKEIIHADRQLGEGAESIYLYYYDTYKKYSESKGDSYWECKVGKSETDPLSRIIGQSATCYPELPHVALIIFCEDSSMLEKTIHDILKLRNKWIKSAPGKEWFLTSPQEIEEIYYAAKGIHNEN